MLQDKQLSIPKEKTRLQNLLWLGKLIVTLLIAVYIFKTFRNEQKGIGDIHAVLVDILSLSNYPALLVMLLLVPLNWALESLKWQTLVSKIIKMSFSDAFRGTLTGLAMGVAVPAQLGDTVGRIAAIRSDKRLEAIGAALISNGIQFYVSIMAGAWGWFYSKSQLAISASGKLAIDLIIVFTVLIGVTAFLFRKKLASWQPHATLLKKAQSYMIVIANYRKGELFQATAWGSLRYLVFLTQFMLALHLFDFPVSALQLAASVSLIFLAKTLIPAVSMLGDLGLREFTALVVFKAYHLPAEKIIAATFLIWVINVLGPIVVGIFLIWKYKWRELFFPAKKNL